MEKATLWSSIKGARRQLLLAAAILISILIVLVIWYFKPQLLLRNVYRADNNIKMVSRVGGEDLYYYDHGSWKKNFWVGINLGATTPGHFPGELSPTYDDYRRWFTDMEKLGIQAVRVYTILTPDFYRALVDHNRAAREKLWLVQGIWSPEEELINQKNAYIPSITAKFNREIDLAVRAVYGRGVIPPRPGKASGHYTIDAGPYLLAWMVGSEWDPYMVAQTNEKNPEKSHFQGQYFAAASQASPFEAWLAASLERLAQEETKTGWQHPVSFVNWVTTDPLSHPNEPFPKEDMVSVDPTHIIPTSVWQAGYFAAYHVYPYYPDSLCYQQDYLDYVNPQGKKDPYEAYLRQLRQHHPGMPFVVAEFGVPSSRGMAHRGPLGRNQGMHTEKEQGEMEAAMFQAIKQAGCTGGILFEWHDEWFKFTWNTRELEIPAERRAMWLNRLTNEENFGLLAVEPGYETRVFLDGQKDDWDKIDDLYNTRLEDGTELMATSDEAYLYLALNKPGGWNWSKDQVYIGFDTQPGGNKSAAGLPITFNPGVEFLLSIDNARQGSLRVASAYDPHTYLYGLQKKMIPWDSQWSKEDNGLFLPWKLCLSSELFLPASKRHAPFEEIEVGQLHGGNTNPDSPDYNSRADFYAGENLLEIRIPWMMLGFTDPSTHQVWSYPYRTHLPHFTAITSPGVTIQAFLADHETGASIGIKPPLRYQWKDWNQPAYHERQKQSYYILQSFFKKLNQP